MLSPPVLVQDLSEFVSLPSDSDLSASVRNGSGACEILAAFVLGTPPPVFFTFTAFALSPPFSAVVSFLSEAAASACSVQPPPVLEDGAVGVMHVLRADPQRPSGTTSRVRVTTPPEASNLVPSLSPGAGWIRETVSGAAFYVWHHLRHAAETSRATTSTSPSRHRQLLGTLIRLIALAFKPKQPPGRAKEGNVGEVPHPRRQVSARTALLLRRVRTWDQSWQGCSS